MTTPTPPVDPYAPNDIPDFKGVNITTLTYQQITEYRQELWHAIWNRGTEYDVLDPQFDAIDHAYRVQLGKVDAQIATFGHNDPAIGQEAAYDT